MYVFIVPNIDLLCHLYEGAESLFRLLYIIYCYRLLATGSNCLLVAACANDPAHIIQLVTVEGLAVDTEFFRNGYTTLHQACEIGFEEVVSTLLDLGANPNKKVNL